MTSVLDTCLTAESLAKLLGRYVRGEVKDPILRKIANYEGAPKDAILPALHSGQFAILDAVAATDNDRRAAVYGYLTSDQARLRMDSLSRRAPALGIKLYYPGRERPPGVMVRRGPGNDPQHVFHFLSAADLRPVAGRGRLPLALLEDLARQFQVIIADLDWGRNGRLWPALKQLFS